MSFLPFLSGLAGGVSDTYGKIADEKRKNDAANKKLVADSIQKRLETDDSLLPDEQTHLLDQYLDLHGVDKKHKESIINASGYFRNAIGENNRKAATDSARASMANPAQLSDVSAPPAKPDDLAGDLPVYQSQATATQLAPEIPKFQAKTAGQLKFEDSQPRVKQGEIDKATAAREAARIAAVGTIEDKIEILKRFKGSPYEDEVRKMVGAAPANTGAFKTQSGVRGHAVADYYRMKGVEVPQGLNPNGLYNLMLTPDQKPAGFVGQEEDAVASAPAQGASFVGMFENDLAGNALNPAMSYVPLHAKKGGDLIGLLPAAQYGTSNSQVNWKVITQADGTSVARPFVETSVTEKTANGQPVANAPAPSAVPSMPVGVAPTQAGAPTPTPAHPLPNAPSAMTPTAPRVTGPNPYSSKFGVGTIVGAKPLTDKEFQNLQGAKEALRGIKDLRAMIEKDPKVLALAAIPGSLGARKYARISGNIADIVTRLKTGAALNEQEEAFYKGQLPGLMDLIGQHFNDPGAIEAALKLHEDMFNSVIQNYGRRAPGGSYYPGEFKVDYSMVPKEDAAKLTGKGETTPKTALPAAPATGVPDKDEIRRQLRGGK